MKKIDKSIISLILIFAAVLFISCGNMFSPKNEGTAESDGKTYLSITVKNGKKTNTPGARTIRPQNYSKEIFTKITLSGMYDNNPDSEENFEIKTNSLSELPEKKELLSGQWFFMLTAEYNGITFTDSKSQYLQKGKENSVSFTLNPMSFYGGCNITFTLGDSVDKVEVTVRKLNESGAAYFENKSLEIKQSEKDGTLQKQVSFAVNPADKTLQAGRYYINFDFYTDIPNEGYKLLNQYESYLIITEALITEATVNLDFNQYYTITYQYIDADGTTIKLENPENFADDESGLIPFCYSKGSEITLPKAKIAGKVFLGWKKQGANDYISEITASESTDLVLEAKTAEPVLYVSGTGDDTSGDGWSIGTAFESIDKACEKIIELGNPDLNWTIYIDGDVTGPHSGTRKAGSRNYSSDYGRSIIPVEITQEHAKSILLKGKNDPGETAGVPNVPTDMINRGLSSSSNSDTGSALVIATAVPVKVENLLIKNGCNKPANSSLDPYSEKGGGLFIASEATVTLGYGVIISNNNAKTAGGGIYNEGTLFINGSAEISSNNCDDGGGGICNTGHLFLGYEDATTKKEWTGSIKNNTSWQGAGIKNLANAELFMSSGSVNHNSCANNSNTSGGGIWNMGSFTMTNGVIEFNDCCQGGGVYNGYSNASEFGTFTFSGGKIKNNFANYVSGTNVSNGGGIYNTGVTYIYGEAIIGDETASSLPADNTGAQERDITNTSIDATCSNLALGLGGGIYVGAQGKLFLGYSRYVDATDNTPAVWNKGIYYNYAKKGGGGIAYGPSAKAVIFNSGTVSFNGATSNGAAAYIGAEGFVLGGTATIPSGNGDGSPKQTVYVLTNNYSLSIDNALSHLDTGAIALLPQDNSNSSAPVPTSYNTYKPLIKLTDTAVANGVTIDSIKGKFTVENFTDPTSGRVTKWSINSEGKAQIETSAGFSASLDTGTADIVVFRNGNRFTPPIVESASSTSTITLDVKTIAGKDFDKSTMTLVWTFDGEELNRASMPEAVSFRYSDSDRQIDINSGMLTKGTYDVSVEATYNGVHYSFTTQIIKN